MPCLTRDRSKRFLDAIRDGRITPERMLKATSKERQTLLGGIIGPENAGWVNAALESKILLKDQKRGMVSWAKKVGGLTPEVRRDLLSTIQKHKGVFDPKTADAFLESLAAKKLGVEVTFDEAKNVSSLASEVAKKKGFIKESDPRASRSRMDYGASVVAFENYTNALKLEAAKRPPSWYLKHPVESLFRLGGVTKSALSTLDNSLFGRQGLNMLINNPVIWSKAFAKSWLDIGKELIGRDAMFAIKSDIVSRPNALNGKYAAIKADLGIGSEEAFPSHIFTKIPYAGRLASAAESAFNGGALRLRADLADKLIRNAERDGIRIFGKKIAERAPIDVFDPVQGESIGKLVNSATGRGDIGKLSSVGREVNVALFSVKLLKSQWDTLTAHQFQKGVTPFVRRQAAMRLARIVGSLAGLYTFMNWKYPGSVELDPRSSRFGKIKIKGTYFDPTGGMSSMVTLAARMAMQSRKDATGKIVQLGTDKFGAKTVVDVVEDYFEGKAAPLVAFFRDYYRGRDFQGRPTRLRDSMIPTLGSIVGQVTPIGVQNFQETMSNPDAAPALATTIADGLGFGATTPPPKSAWKSKAPENWLEEIRQMLGKQ